MVKISKIKRLMIEPRKPRGFSMIEVLVAMVILAVGILGVASLQGSSLRFTHNAQLRSQATTIAQDMVERLRTNRDFALASNENYQVNIGATASGEILDCTSNNCSAIELAEFDKDQWLESIENLPKGKGSVTVDSNTRAATILVMWDNDRTGASGTACGNNTEIDLTCMSLKAHP